MSYLKISRGTIIDPANRIDGEVADIWIENGRIVPEPPGDVLPARIIDAQGMIVMPGGIDMHCHIAGPKVNAARKLQPEMTRQAMQLGAMANVPDIVTTGMRYTGLGYTTCFDAAIAPLTSRHVHHEFSQIPNLDTGFFVLVGNNHFVMDRIAHGDQKGLTEFVAWLLHRTGGYAPKLVNPGGVECWKRKYGGNARDLDQEVDGFGISPRQIIQEITRATNSLGLPHPVHIHCNNLGIPGNWETTLESMKSIQGQKSHFAHIQFHSYGGDRSDPTSLCSRVAELAEFVNQDGSITVDVGQIMFGKTTSMTGDSPLGYYLQQITGQSWYSNDTELESGCGVSPINYRDKGFVHSLQWAIGLEWYLMVDDPWKVVMSTDSPNGGSFLAYPQIIRLLMDRNYRNQALKSVNPRVLDACTLADLDREYTLEEIAIITRAGPAKILGLSSKGHLGIGADADVTIYVPDDDIEQMFSVPRWVLQRGNVVVDDFEVRDVSFGNTLSLATPVDGDFVSTIDHWFRDHYSLHMKHYGINDGEFERIQRLAISGGSTMCGAD